MQRRNWLRIGAAATAALIGLSTSAAFAQPSGTAPERGDQYAVINGIKYGPDDGLEIDEYVTDVAPGSDPVVKNFPSDAMPGQAIPQIAWGGSYATTSETAQLRYTTKAKAAANIYNGKRIIQVCVWYTRSDKRVGPKSCSNASAHTGQNDWTPGKVVSHSVWDTLNPIAPKTKWHYSTARVNPHTGMP